MAFVYCRKCDWSQDDFWSKSYNPMNSPSDWIDQIIKYDLNEPLAGHFDSYALKEMGLESKTYREFFMYELEKNARKIKNMKWKTEKDFKDDQSPTCPSCGGTEFTMD